MADADAKAIAAGDMLESAGMDGESGSSCRAESKNLGCPADIASLVVGLVAAAEAYRKDWRIPFLYALLANLDQENSIKVT